MLVHRRVTPGIKFAGTHFYTMLKNTTQCPRPGLGPRPRDPETSALTMRPPHLHHALLKTRHLITCKEIDYLPEKVDKHPEHMGGD